jgi:hypothetical protein
MLSTEEWALWPRFPEPFPTFTIATTAAKAEEIKR